MSFQGYLTDENEVPIDGNQDMTISLWTAAGGGSQAWTRAYTGVEVNNGVFNVLFSEGTPSFGELDFEDSLWVAVSIGAVPITPRTQLTAVPFARGLSLPVSGKATSATSAFYVNNIGFGKAGEFVALNNSGVRGSTGDVFYYGGVFEGGKGVFARGWSNSAPDLVLGGESTSNDDGRIYSDPNYPNSDIWLHSNDAIVMQLDDDANGIDADFEIRNNTGTIIFNVDDDGTVTSAGTVAHSSDRNQKEGIVAVDALAILEKVGSLPVSEWRYKGQSTKHVGPMAQDFAEAFEVGADDTHIAGLDADGVALAAIKGLYEMVKAQQLEIERLQRAIEEK